MKRERKFIFVMKKKIATVPKVVEAKSGSWYVYFSVRNPLTDKMKPFKIYQGFKERRTIKEKRDWGAQLAKEYADRLREGWMPFDDKEDVIYSDHVEYANMVNSFSAIKKGAKNSRYFLSEFLQSRKVVLREKTYQTYQSKLRIFCNWLDKYGYGDYDVSAINNAIIKEFFMFITEKLDRLTIEKYEQIIRAYYEHLVKIGRATKNPVHSIDIPPKRKDMGARPINKKDMTKLMGVIKEHDPQLYLACMFIYYLALRPGQEMRLLKIKDVDLYNNIVIVVDGQAKTTRRTIDMAKPLVELCQEYYLTRFNKEYYVFGRRGVPGPDPTGKNTLRVRFNNVRDKLGLSDSYKFYSMKHTGGGNLLKSGATIEEIRHHMGHRSIETTDRYLRKHFGRRNKTIIEHFPPPV